MCLPTVASSSGIETKNSEISVIQLSSNSSAEVDECFVSHVSLLSKLRAQSEFTIFIDNKLKEMLGIMSIIGIVHEHNCIVQEHNGSEVWELLKSIIGKNENIIDSCLSL